MPNPFIQSPFYRRLERDLVEMEELRAQSSIFDFESAGSPPNEYLVTFHGNGLAGTVQKPFISELHQARIHLGPDYPQRLPSIIWETPIVHPNVHIHGSPCFGGFAMSPGVRLVDLMEITWDMIRMAVFNMYNALDKDEPFQILRKTMGFPVDQRILRDRAPRPAREPEGGTPDIIIMGRQLRLGRMNDAEER